MMSILDRVKAMLRKQPVSFTERPKAETQGHYTGRTTRARIGRHRRVQAGNWDLANVCPTCGGLPTASVRSKKDSHRLYQCANQHTWAD